MSRAREAGAGSAVALMLAVGSRARGRTSAAIPPTEIGQSPGQPVCLRQLPHRARERRNTQVAQPQRLRTSIPKSARRLRPAVNTSLSGGWCSRVSASLGERATVRTTTDASPLRPGRAAHAEERSLEVGLGPSQSSVQCRSDGEMRIARQRVGDHGPACAPPGSSRPVDRAARDDRALRPALATRFWAGFSSTRSRQRTR